jgi:hypothetical protein
VKIEPRAFLAIENSMAGAMRAEWDKLAGSIITAIHADLVNEDWANAQAKANTLTMSGVVRNVRARLEELAVSALIFGAHRVTGDTKTTGFMKGKPLPFQFHAILDQLQHAVESDAADYVRNAVHKLIEAMKRGDATQHLQKSTTYDAQLTNATRTANDPNSDVEPDASNDAEDKKEKLYGEGRYAATGNVEKADLAYMVIPPEVLPRSIKKDDLTVDDLLLNGGLQSPEQAGPRKKRKFLRKEDLGSLYVHRDLKHPAPFLRWAKEQGFKTTVPTEDLHVTIVYSKDPVDWDKLEPRSDEITVGNDKRTVEQLGDAVVLRFNSERLAEDNAKFMEAGCTSKFPTYKPHVTIPYDAGDLDISKVIPFDGNMTFGNEVFEEIDDDGFDSDSLVEQVLKHDRRARLRKADDDQALMDKLNDAVFNGGSVASDLGASLTTSRLVTLGFLVQAGESEATQYQVDEILDERTCPVCIYMNGKTFNVDSQYARTMQALGADDPATLKTITPWPGQSNEDLAELYGLSLDELQSSGYGAPPYHPGCRGMLTLVGTVMETIPLGGPTDDDPISLDSPTVSAESIDFGPVHVDTQEEPSTDLDAPFDQPQTDVQSTANNWDQDKIDMLGWERFNVTDPIAFKAIDDAYNAGDYDTAQELLDQWNASNVKKDDKIPPADDQGFEGPNAPRKKRKPQAAAGKETDYQDIASDSSNQAFDNAGVSDEANAGIDR